MSFNIRGYIGYSQPETYTGIAFHASYIHSRTMYAIPMDM